MNRMLSCGSVRKRASLHRKASPSGNFPRRPNSYVRAMTGSSGGSAANALESARSVGVGARELRRSGSAEPLAVGEEGRQMGERLVGEPHGRAKAIEVVVSVEIQILARSVADGGLVAQPLSSRTLKPRNQSNGRREPPYSPSTRKAAIFDRVPIGDRLARPRGGRLLWSTVHQDDDPDPGQAETPNECRPRVEARRVGRDEKRCHCQ